MSEVITGPDRALLVETTKIVAAYVTKHVIPLPTLAALITNVHAAINNTAGEVPVLAAAEKNKPAVAVRKSVQEEQITCLECGNEFKSLKRHLMTHHSVSPAQYREKWALPAAYPMSAPAYSEVRSRLAREMGLGRGRKNGSVAETGE